MLLDTYATAGVAQAEFLSAEALGITESQRDALITVLGMMERGEITEETFHMAMWCGTSCCIGGHASLVGGRNLFACARPRELEGLFYPRVSGGFRVTNPRRGALALRSYLSTGTANWQAAMEAAL
jgi:hypothetical protein